MPRCCQSGFWGRPQGRTPMETFLAGIDLYQRFVYDNEEVMEEAA
jgi:hypothetical protein